MTPHDLLANFEILAEAPNGLQRLRELVLELAVRGKLVEQDPADEPANDLIRQIKAEKSRLRLELGGESPISRTEEPFDLPPTWRWVRLSGVCSYIQRGKSPSYVDKSNIPVVSQKCVQWSGFDISRARYIEESTLPAYGPERVLQEGDLLWNSTGLGTLGRVAVYRQPTEYPKVVADSHVTIVRPLFLVPQYVFCWLSSPTVQSVIQGQSTGSTKQTELPRKVVLDYLVPLAPLAEQRRIVARVDELMTLLDRLETKRQVREAARAAARDSALAALREATTPEDVETGWLRIQDQFVELFTTPEDIQPLRELVVDLAVSGKLVAQKPEDGHAMDLVYKFPRVTWGGPGRTLLDSKAVAAEPPAASVKLPSTWALLKLEMLTALDKPISYGVLVPGENIEGGVPLVRIGDLTTSKNPPMPAKSISQTIADEYSRVLLEGGELLLGVVGSIGKVGKAPDSWRGAVIARAVARIATIPLVESHYLLLVLQSSLVQRYFRGETRTLAQPTLNVGLIRSTPIPLPPIQEQVRIVARVDELMKMLDRLAGAVEGGMALSRAFAAAAVHHLEA